MIVRRPAVLLLALVAIGCSAPSEPTASTTVATAPPAASLSSQLPPGLPVETAKAKAAAYAPLNATFSKATAGLYRDFPPELQDSIVDPNRAVWGITYDSIATPCYPGGSVCESPRPGAVTVFLDYYTGDFLESGGSFPKP